VIDQAPRISATVPIVAVSSDAASVSLRKSVLRGVPPWSVSLTFHLVALLVLAFWTLIANKEHERPVLVAATVDETELEIQELADVEFEKLDEIEPQPVSLDRPSLAPNQIPLGNVTPWQPDSFRPMPAVADVATYEIGALFGSRGQGMTAIGEGLGAASFFGAKAKGSRFVFVVDNSNSMGRGRFETALDELMKTVEGMAPYQYFYVIFFSDTAYPLFHPDPSSEMVRATDENKQKLRRWLGTIEMCLKTRGEEAMRLAFAMQPDAIYILGDGRFTDRAGVMLVAAHKRQVPIHTLGMEVDAIGKREFQAIAKANHGTYLNVSASRRAQAMARTHPVARNWRRGTVWGITLSETESPRRRRP